MSKVILLLLILSLVSARDLLPKDIENPTRYNSFISDPDQYLSSSSISKINEMIRSIQKLQVGVLLIEKVPNSFYYTKVDQKCVEFAKQVFDLWGIGDDESNNGLLILISVVDREYRIVTGAGAMKIVSNSDSDYIFNRQKESLRDQNYSGAILNSLDLIKRASEGEDLQALSFFEKMFIFLIIVVVLGLIIKKYQYSSNQNTFEEKLQKLQNHQKKNENFAKFISENCSICLEEFQQQSNEIPQSNQENEKSKQIILRCGHNFHKDCLESWLTRHNTCPICKAKDPLNPGQPEEIPLNNKSNQQPSRTQNSLLDDLISIQFQRYNIDRTRYLIRTDPNLGFSFSRYRPQQSTSFSSSTFGGGSSRGGGGGGGRW